MLPIVIAAATTSIIEERRKKEAALVQALHDQDVAAINKLIDEINEANDE